MVFIVLSHIRILLWNIMEKQTQTSYKWRWRWRPVVIDNHALPWYKCSVSLRYIVQITFNVHYGSYVLEKDNTHRNFAGILHFPMFYLFMCFYTTDCVNLTRFFSGQMSKRSLGVSFIPLLQEKSKYISNFFT